VLRSRPSSVLEFGRIIAWMRLTLGLSACILILEMRIGVLLWNVLLLWLC
jgi:hypothetical protein